MLKNDQRSTPPATGEGSDVVVDVDEHGLAWVAINRPHKHNALAGAVLDSLARSIRNLADDARTRCIILRGAGDQYFAAGGDLVELAAVRSDEQINAMADRATMALDAVRDCPVPVVAYVNGDALGGGAELAMACDLRVFASHARIGFVQGRMGITSAWGGGPDLCALVGPARAMTMMTRCEMVDADRALAWGLADLKVRDGPAGEDLQRFLEPLLERSRAVLQGIKSQTTAWRNGLTALARRRIERTELLTTWASVEHWDAVDRFLAKRKA